MEPSRESLPDTPNDEYDWSLLYMTHRQQQRSVRAAWWGGNGLNAPGGCEKLDKGESCAVRSGRMTR